MNTRDSTVSLLESIVVVVDAMSTFTVPVVLGRAKSCSRTAQRRTATR